MISGSEVDALTSLALMLGLGVLAVLVIREHPRAGAAAWLASVCLVPVWIGATAGVYLTAHILVALGVLFALSLQVRRPNPIVGQPVPLGRQPVPVGRKPDPVGRQTVWLDAAALAFFAACALGIVTGRWSWPVLFAVLSVWVLGYAFGRILPGWTGLEWLRAAIAVALAGVAALAVIEALAAWNPFVGISQPNSLYAVWGPIQVRGGEARVEGAFGHSIALGCSLALAIPFAMAARLNLLLRICMVALMGAAIAMTLSRIALISAAVAVVLTLVFGRLARRERAWFGAVAGIGALAILPMISTVMSRAGDEASQSSAYRGALATLVPDIDILGEAANSYTSPSGEHFWGRYTSVDSALLLVGLHFGWIALGLLLLMLVGALASLRLRRTPPEVIALIALTPAYLSVALITQYAMLVWFVVGMAAHAMSGSRAIRDGSALQEQDGATGSLRTSESASQPERKATHAHA